VGASLRSRSTGGRDGRGEGDVGSRSAAHDFEESAHFLASGKGQKVVGGQSRTRVQQEARRGQGGDLESGSWGADSGQQEARRGQGGGLESGSWGAERGQSDGETSGGSGQSDGEAAAAASRMKKRLAADASGRGGAGMSVHTRDSDSDGA
jgi:hypothetical protein